MFWAKENGGRSFGTYATLTSVPNDESVEGGLLLGAPERRTEAARNGLKNQVRQVRL